MIKSTLKHENLRRVIEELGRDADDDEVLEKLIPELNHSCLISPVTYENDEIKWLCGVNEEGNFGMLFTDMSEFRKTFPELNFASQENDFFVYKLLFEIMDIDGFVLNPDSEGIILDERFFKDIDEDEIKHFSTDDTYTSQELKQLKDSMDNKDLEEFIANPNNIGKYEELFELMSKSTLLTLMLSRKNLKDSAKEGVIYMEKTNPQGFLYIDEIGGEYVTLYTSESKISNVKSEFYKYSQIVNFSQMVYFLLNFDMDGVIINPGAENVMLTREVLLEYSSLLNKTFNDSKLNSAIFHMFLMENEVYI